MRVLVIKTSSLGDVVHTLPALTDAARALPGIRFDWVVEEGFAEIPAWHPAVDRVIPVAIRRWRKNLWQTIRSGEWRQFKQRLREGDYDLVIDAQGLLKSAWLTRYCTAPVAGLGRDSAREPLASRFYDRTYRVPKEQHALERTRQLFAQALGYPLPEGVGDYGLNRAALAGPASEPYLVFLHGTTWASKHWPETDWRALAERMSGEGWAIRLPWGNAAEKARADCRGAAQGRGVAQAESGWRRPGDRRCPRLRGGGYRSRPSGGSAGCAEHFPVRPDPSRPRRRLWAWPVAPVRQRPQRGQRRPGKALLRRAGCRTRDPRAAADAGADGLNAAGCVLCTCRSAARKGAPSLCVGAAPRRLR